MSLPPPPPSAPSSTVPGTGNCYRHPNREAGRRCTRCGRWACTDCLVQASVGSHCVECAKASKPDTRTRARYWNSRQAALVTTSIIVVNIAVFIYTVIKDPQALGGRTVTIGHWQLGLFQEGVGDGLPGVVQLHDGTLYTTEGGQWYRLITSGFLHYGIVHLGLNMYLLYQLGNMIEPAIGRVRFFLLYMASLLGGSALELVLGKAIVDGGGVAGGASGAVFGLMGFAAIGYWLRGINPLSTQIGTLLLLNLFITFAFSNISIGGHIGGGIAGALCGLTLAAPGHRGVPRWATYATPIAVAALSVAISIAAVA